MRTPHPSTEFDYTRHVLRTDDTCPPGSEIAAPGDPDLTAALTGDFAATAPVITGIWREIAPDVPALGHMCAVLGGFIRHSQRLGHRTWNDVVPADVETFVHAAELPDDARRLRKNTIQAAYLALADASIYDGYSPADGIDPVPEETREDQRGKRRGAAAEKKTRRHYGNRVHVRAATHDEILLIRLATRFTASSRATHLAAAAVSLCSSTATTGEAPQVIWSHLQATGTPSVTLPGRTAAPGFEETAIVARTVPLDRWDAQALTHWQQERSAVRPVPREASILYTGNKALDSTSAGVCADQAVRKALEVADLRREPGLSAGSLRLWSAARDVTDYASLRGAAARAGVQPMTLHREINHLGERAILVL